MNGLLGALGLLTRIPVPTHRATPSGAAAGWFPVVGAVVGGIVAGAYALGSEVLPPSVAAFVAVLAGVLATGGLHEDGLGDSFDALGARGDRDDAIRVLKDPRLGSYGTLALISSLVLRAGAIASMDAWSAAAMIVCAHAVARGIAVGTMALVPASSEGLGSTFSGTLTEGRAAIAVGVGVAIGSIAAGIWGPIAFAVAVFAVALALRPLLRRLGGISGDVLGAIEQTGEIVILLLGSAIVTQGWTEPAWWL